MLFYTFCNICVLLLEYLKKQQILFKNQKTIPSTSCLSVFLECLGLMSWRGCLLPVPPLQTSAEDWGLFPPFQRAAGSEQVQNTRCLRAAKEHGMGKLLGQDRRHSHKEGWCSHPIVPGKSSLPTCACQEGSCQLKFIWKHCVLALTMCSTCALFWKLGGSYFPDL